MKSRFQDDALWRRNVIGDKEVLREFLRRVGPIFVEVRDAIFGQESIVDQKAAGEFARRAREYGAGRVGHDSPG